MIELINRYTNEHSKFINVQGIELHYRDEGKGFPIVLIHGAFSSLHTFDGWAELLTENYRVIRYTLPGFGLTGPDADHNYSMQNHIQYLMKLLDHLKIRQCHIAGNSLGGWLAWESVLHHPERFKKLILIAAAGYLDPTSVPTPFKMARTPFLKKIVRYGMKKSVLSKYVAEVYGNPEQIDPYLVNRYYELFARDENIEAFFKLVNIKHKDNTPHLREILNDTLILWGEMDRWLPLQNGYRFTTAIPHSRLFTYSGIGHVPMEEIPKKTARDVLRFLQAKQHEEISLYS